METTLEYMSGLNWTFKELEEAEKILKEWDNRQKSFYKNRPKYVFNADMAEREHLRNCINFWKEKYEDQ